VGAEFHEQLESANIGESFRLITGKYMISMVLMKLRLGGGISVVNKKN